MRQSEGRKTPGTGRIVAFAIIGCLLIAAGFGYGGLAYTQDWDILQAAQWFVHDSDSERIDATTEGAGQDDIDAVEEMYQDEDVSTEMVSGEAEEDDTSSADDGSTDTNDLSTEDTEGTSTEISLVMIGDMLMHTTVVNSGLQDDGTYNFDHLFVNVADQIAAADIAIVNQETIMGGDNLGFSGYPNFNSPTALADAEAAVGFDVILHGTNHALDKGAQALLNCMDYWEANYPQIAYLGVHKSQEAYDNDLYVYEKDGIRIAILNYTYGTNGISVPSGMSYLVEYLDKDRIEHDVARAKEAADFVVVCPHWGTEYNTGTDSQQAKWTQIFLDAGVDLVIGTHPHVIEPVEWVEGTDGHRMLVYYSLGNFVNAHNSGTNGIASRTVGGMAAVTIGYDEDGNVAVMDYEAIPLVCHRSYGSAFTVYYLEDYTEELAQANRARELDSSFSLDACWSVVSSVWGISRDE